MQAWKLELLLTCPLQEFKKNVKGCNGGGDFDQDMLEEIYAAIKQDEIVMPAEQTGVVRENYLWKVTPLRNTCRVSVLFLLLIVCFINMHLLQELMCIFAHNCPCYRLC